MKEEVWFGRFLWLDGLFDWVKVDFNREIVDFFGLCVIYV